MCEENDINNDLPEISEDELDNLVKNYGRPLPTDVQERLMKRLDEERAKFTEKDSI